MDSRVADALSGELARQVVGRLAPDELAVFDPVAQEYFADPQAVLSPARREEAVGFGLDLAMLTPYALAVAGPVVTWLVATVSTAAREESEARITSWVRGLFRRGPAPGPPVPPLTDEQARTVHRIAVRQARAVGLPDQQAALVADAIVGAIRVG
ncbi:hypothetical protein [Pseudonocardia humida]|uniref:TetR family transcriptional regulator n=1 Tax=Pseudonocardia humida TaxID=2800819 RepID=A0ABT1AA89_9PSEU|nr:hypothetical protein [Pseudonocardia humida]MCO1659840.1 hypothetical protein [Pseudonocardia humida]